MLNCVAFLTSMRRWGEVDARMTVGGRRERERDEEEGASESV